MKTLTATLLMAMALVASGQTNLTPEQEAARGERQQRAREMSEKLLQATIKAQQRAASNQAARPMPVKGFGEEKFVTPLYHPTKPPIINTTSPVPIQALSIMERMRPGSTTNILPSQLFDAETNAAMLKTREFFRNTPALPADIKPSDTNFNQKLEEWKSWQFQTQELKKPSGGGDNTWTNEGISWWSLTFQPFAWPNSPATPYYKPGTTNLCMDPLEPFVEVEYASIWGTNNIRRFQGTDWFSLPDFEGLFGVLHVSYPELCWLPDTSYFCCTTGKFWGAWSGTLEPFFNGAEARMSGGYVDGIWIFVPNVAGVGQGRYATFSINWQGMWPPTKAMFFTPPFSQGPMIEPVGAPGAPPVNLPPAKIHQFGAAFTHQQIEVSSNLVNWTVWTNAVTDESGVLSVEIPNTKSALFVRGTSTP